MCVCMWTWRSGQDLTGEARRRGAATGTATGAATTGMATTGTGTGRRQREWPGQRRWGRGGDDGDGDDAGRAGTTWR